MNTKKRLHISLKKLISVFMLLVILALSLASCGDPPNSKDVLSPALNCLAEQNSMAKSALKGNMISFCAEDFARAVNRSDIEQIKITALPPLSEGQLRIGSTLVNENQILSASSIEFLTYVPASNLEKESEFKFTVDNMAYEMSCKLYILDEKNHAPTLSTAPKTALEVSTHQNVTYFGKLPCYDPDGDTTYVEIVSYPEKGVLLIEDSQSGEYCFIPNKNSSGNDEFKYVARDKYGNYSPAATVSLSIQKPQTSVTYVDLVNSPYHNAALTMTEKGVMSGTKVGNNSYFYPSQTVSRGEFIVMAMNAAGIKELNPVNATVFADDEDIPSQMKSYISAAYDLGYVKGLYVDGKLCFEANRAITRAECATVLASMLNASTPTVKPVFSDSEDIPTWAQAAINSLGYMGVMQSENNNAIRPTANLTRGDAAQILANFMVVDK